jgi:pantoate--beta-alanine ligase
MQIFQTQSALKTILDQERKETKTIGFVPTMGALHSGHLELVRRCVAENDICVVSIFVNPTQFNNKSDLLNYPRDLGADSEMLKKIGCHYVFAPSEDEIYPEPDTRVFNFGNLADVMEGQFRPGHFNGVAQVVSKLFDIVMPDRAYFGLKDFQQLVIIRDLVKQLNLNVEIVPVPIIREKDGLAMSSRNMRLNPEQRKEAANISRVLKESGSLHKLYTVAELKIWVRDQINQSPELDVEYFDIVDGFTLKSIVNWEDTEYPVGCIAVFAGDVRLIDNIIYN